MSKKQKEERKDVLVALLPRKNSLEILQSEGWYHIPVNSPAEKRIPPRMLAFYQGKSFGKEEAYKVRYYGEVEDIEKVPRKILFPNDEKNADKAEKLYYRLRIKELKERPVPIFSHRPRRMVFIPTTQDKFELAEQVNDLVAGSHIEERLWRALKYIDVLAERQWKVFVQKKPYYLDFAIFCNEGKLAIETDGYTFHYDSRNQIDYDTWRQNEISLDNWHFLRYTSRQVKDNWTPYLAQIKKKVEQLGGQEKVESFSRKVGEERGAYIVDGEEPL
jgi:very-short-patch-repair endonuclease